MANKKENAPKASESLKCSYVRILYNISRILVMSSDPARQVICSVQMREEELFKAPPVIFRQSIGPALAHIIPARDRFYAEATISTVSLWVDKHKSSGKHYFLTEHLLVGYFFSKSQNVAYGID